MGPNVIRKPADGFKENPSQKIGTRFTRGPGPLVECPRCGVPPHDSVSRWRLTGCGREPDPPPDAPRCAAAPKPPGQPHPARAADRIAFVREDGLWTVHADGGDLQRIVPPTCPRAAEPAWAPDRRWLAFTAALDPDSNLYPRNLFVARPDGSDLRQVTPIPRAGLPPDDGPKGIVRGRAVLGDPQRPPALPGLRVTAYGAAPADLTDADGNFQTYLPVGRRLGQARRPGRREPRPRLALRGGVEGRVTDLKDVPARPSATTTSPARPPGAPTADSSSTCSAIRRRVEDRRSARHAAPHPDSTAVGDETVASFTDSPIIAGPVVRAGFRPGASWPTATLLRVRPEDQGGRRDPRPAGISAPDALAVSPDGGRIATLTRWTRPARSRWSLVAARSPPRPSRPSSHGEPAPHAHRFLPRRTRGSCWTASGRRQVRRSGS